MLVFIRAIATSDERTVRALLSETRHLEGPYQLSCTDPTGEQDSTQKGRDGLGQGGRPRQVEIKRKGRMVSIKNNMRSKWWERESEQKGSRTGAGFNSLELSTND